MVTDAMLTRRAILAASAATLTTQLSGGRTWAEAGGAAYLSAARIGADAYALFGLSARGDIVFRHRLLSRGHAAAAHPRQAMAVAFARRPGRFGLVLDCASGQITHRLEPPPGRHFYGHGAFSADGARLLTTENDIETGQGRIGIWSVRDGYRRMGEQPSGGIGPHEIIRLQSGQFAVANGGIRTHPDTGRKKLNLATMRPNLTYLDDHAAIIEQIEAPHELRLYSLRHIASDASGLVAVAAQWQGDLYEAPPLLALHRAGGPLRFLDAGMARQRDMNGYAGSVAFRGDGTEVAITSPRGGTIQSFALNGTLAFHEKHDDICGLSAAGSGYLATSGDGSVWEIGTNHPTPQRHAAPKRHTKVAWDNHIVAV